MSEKPSSVSVDAVERDPAELVAGDVRDPVVPREPFVDESVVGGQKLDDAPVLAHEIFEE